MSSASREKNATSSSKSATQKSTDCVPSFQQRCGNNQPCFFDDRQNLRNEWPDLKWLPRPEPSDKEDHKSWEIEYRDWGHRQCNNGKGYFCREHGRWVACREVTEGAAPSKQSQGNNTCPRRHYTDSIALEQQSASLAASSTSAHKSTASAYNNDQNAQWASNQDPPLAPYYTTSYVQPLPTTQYSVAQYPIYQSQDTLYQTFGGAQDSTTMYQIQSSTSNPSVGLEMHKLSISDQPEYSKQQTAPCATELERKESQRALAASESKSSIHKSRHHEKSKSKSSTREHGSGKSKTADHHDSHKKNLTSNSESKRRSTDKVQASSSASRNQTMDRSDKSSHANYSIKGKEPAAEQITPSEVPTYPTEMYGYDSTGYSVQYTDTPYTAYSQTVQTWTYDDTDYLYAEEADAGQQPEASTKKKREKGKRRP